MQVCDQLVGCHGPALATLGRAEDAVKALLATPIAIER